MKIKNFKISKDVVPYIVSGIILVVATGGSVAYYCYENQEQIVVDSISNDDTFIDDDGNICHLFDVGEHRISISRNDKYCNLEAPQGYTIESVKIGVFDNNKIIYVNDEPVIAMATEINDKEAVFNNFGTVTEKEHVLVK